MSITMRIVQRFQAGREHDFMRLEREFAQLEGSRPGWPRGRRLQPISALEPCNTLIWESDFPDLQSAQAALELFSGDNAHESLAAEQSPLFEQVRVEFYRNLDFTARAPESPAGADPAGPKASA